MRLAGQNPTVAQADSMIAEADADGTGMLMFSDMVPILEKYWRNSIIFESEIRDACRAFDKKEEGVIVFEELKNALLNYGDILDENDAELIMKHFNAGDGKIIVEEFVKNLLPPEPEVKKPKAGKKGTGKGSAKKGKKR